MMDEMGSKSVAGLAHSIKLTKYLHVHLQCSWKEV